MSVGSTEKNTILPRTRTPIPCSRKSTLHSDAAALPVGVEGRDDSKLCAMYVQEATEHDNAMLQGSHASLDVMLIMAGLFSAVLTAFLIESYTLLQPDPQDAMVQSLTVIAEILMNNGTRSVSPTSLPRNNDNFKPALSAWLINAFWFFSLVCSLSAAFVAMLAKQWLQAYNLGRHGRVETHARQRHLRYSGFLKWLASDIIYTLPVVLQFSFSLFFIGLDILVWSINKPIGYLVTFCTALLLGFYLFTTIAPLVDLSCPYQTPFSLQLAIQVRRIYFKVCDGISKVVGVLDGFIHKSPTPRAAVYKAPSIAISHVDREHKEIEKLHHSIDLGIIEYLVGRSHQEEIVDSALIAISSLRPNFSPTRRLRDCGAIELLVNHLNSFPLSPSNAAAALFKDHAANSLPYLASLFCSLRFCTRDDIAPIMDRFGWRTWIVLWGDFTLQKLISEEWDVDTLAIYLCASAQCERAEKRRPDRAEGPRRHNREFNVMIDLLNCHYKGEITLSEFSVWALVESIAIWGAEFDKISMEIMRPIVTACLLRLLTLPYSMGDPMTRAVGIAFAVFVLDYKEVDMVHYRDEENRRMDAHRLLIYGVLNIIKVHLSSNLTARYALDRESFEIGGTVLCQLLVDNTAPTPWPDGTSIALLGVLGLSQSEKLQCKVLDTFRRLLAFDGQSNLPNLLSSIAPSLESSVPHSVQLKATQAIGEMRHWKTHRQAILRHDQVIAALVRNLESPNSELSNASSLALIDLSRDQETMALMVRHGLADSLTGFFSSSNATRHNLVHWSWSFVKSPSSVREFWSRHLGEFKGTLEELANALEHMAQFEDDDSSRSFDGIPSTPSKLPKGEFQKTVRALRDICVDHRLQRETLYSFFEADTQVDLSVSIGYAK